MPPLPSPPPTPPSLRRPWFTPSKSLSPVQRPATTPRVLISTISKAPCPTPWVIASEIPPVPAHAPSNTPRVNPPVTQSLPTPVSSTAPLRRYPQRRRTPTNRYGFAALALADQSFEEKYMHHIAAFASAPPPVAKDSKLPSLSKLLKGDDGKLWGRSTANAFGRLFANGVGRSRPVAERIEGTGTSFPIRKSAIPKGRNITYGNFICAIRFQKTETHRVHLTFGGDKLDFPGDPSSPAVSLLTTKTHLNNTISDARKGSRYCTLDLKNFFLGSPMDYRQYARVHASLIPDEIFHEYPDLVVEGDGYV